MLLDRYLVCYQVKPGPGFVQTGSTLRLARVSRVLMRCRLCEFLAYCDPELSGALFPGKSFPAPCPERAARCSARACPPPALDRGTTVLLLGHSDVNKERQDRTGQNKQELKNRQNKQKQTKPYLQNKQLISACGSRAGQRMQEEGKYML